MVTDKYDNEKGIVDFIGCKTILSAQNMKFNDKVRYSVIVINTEICCCRKLKGKRRTRLYISLQPFLPPKFTTQNFKLDE